MNFRRASSALMGTVALGLVGAGLVASCTNPAPAGPSSSPHASHVPTPVQTPAPTPTPTPGPYADQVLYLDEGANAMKAYNELVAQGRTDQAEAIEPIARTPSAVWFGGEGDPYPSVEALMDKAQAQGAMPVLVAYNIPGRDCGLYSSGGSDGIDEYLTWIGSFAAALEGREAIIILEPDAVAHSITGCTTAESDARHRMLELAVEIFQREPGAHVYIDAGNASWVDDIHSLAVALQESGVDDADGFALNVSNFEPTDKSIVYGQELSEHLGGKHFVIDTSRNGAGSPPSDGRPDGDWCNPMQARLGEQPTLDTGVDRVDALLWVKHPGDSDGECSPGAPAAGEWWPDFAYALTQPS